MSVKFKSQATGDLVMVQAHARALLRVLGKSADEPGILEVADMPSALQTLRQLPQEAVEPADQVGDERDEQDDERDVAEPGAERRSVPFMDESVSLGQRAWPLIRMIERAQAESKPIVWGV